jgi:hypothetical protein
VDDHVDAPPTLEQSLRRGGERRAIEEIGGQDERAAAALLDQRSGRGEAAGERLRVGRP